MRSLLISPKEIQRYLVGQGQIIKIDGDIGKRTRAAIGHVLTVGGYSIANWSAGRRLIAIQQIVMKREGAEPGAIDGLLGPNTRYAVEVWQNLMRDKEGATVDLAGAPWPCEANVPTFYGPPGAHLVRVKFPYKMWLAWEPKKVVTSGMFHEKVAESLQTVLKNVLKKYGQSRIEALGLNIYSGGYAPRRKRGGSSWSMHAYGIALDFDDTHNQFRWTSDRARFARPEYYTWWHIWEAEGWVSLGREKNFDWMHVQAARL